MRTFFEILAFFALITLTLVSFIMLIAEPTIGGAFDTMSAMLIMKFVGAVVMLGCVKGWVKIFS